ncbi:hypothetical protein ASPWEDRAFT_39716 [Aspergillus wentii DTO 134E9]|uniref:CDP-diacylglycerol phosphatidylhydrolase n=1 Tax=Aspergillus wentii DTO 134E9 TaxID=1073089 RepID=A0A1L9RI80_ASPWE|nr:uncharacterized protein ASPWEDRAFT_39716 [Aspergillus wentii DTO 134E9]OJJ34636.1 hypothetical protein ASPWEDRAFT_39716 [Aspergillus wentii DTO 134E9]
MIFQLQQSISAIYVLLLILPWNANAASDCTQDDISRLSVSNCDCRDRFTTCPTTCPIPNACGTSFGKLRTCNQGCSECNHDCDACNLYFGGLCRCLKQQDCFHDSNTGSWTLLHAEDLITTPRLLPGILELNQDNGGWKLGQIVQLKRPHHTFANGALAMNSAAARTQEQIHIHVCENQGSAFRQYIEQKLKPTNFQTLQDTGFSAPFFKAKVLCQAQNLQGSADFEMGKLIFNYMSKLSQNCDKYHLGAGLINDKNGFTWGCVTQGGGAEELFCKN